MRTRQPTHSRPGPPSARSSCLLVDLPLPDDPLGSSLRVITNPPERTYLGRRAYARPHRARRLQRRTPALAGSPPHYEGPAGRTPDPRPIRSSNSAGLLADRRTPARWSSTGGGFLIITNRSRSAGYSPGWSITPASPRSPAGSRPVTGGTLRLPVRGHRPAQRARPVGAGPRRGRMVPRTGFRHRSAPPPHLQDRRLRPARQNDQDRHAAPDLDYHPAPRSPPP